ncbi:peptide methionine sulfoxide reductase [Nonlabens spongiae]|uniref:peptide-methionine (S)-S-oxide reductase n=1 Tax=Nonlabens spongiae TaxID=331648 RepID=A0A1W6MGF8_9FLAO|nr:peptide-methionine (S)-S-oxide reductase [Nonlabens spongiae]ARN76667.1 peptide methionine sulfoxide reductase [Nonlabens spongiae]
MSNKKLDFGGGCHWCTEAVFQALPYVDKVEQGYIKSSPPFDSWSEAVIVHFSDHGRIPELMDIHLATHKSTSEHSRRAEYRSAVYYFDNGLKKELESVIIPLSRCADGKPCQLRRSGYEGCMATEGKRNKNYITKILPFKDFKPSRESIQNYYQTRPDAPFCTRYIEPKLSIVREILSSSDK